MRSFSLALGAVVLICSCDLPTSAPERENIRDSQTADYIPSPPTAAQSTHTFEEGSLIVYWQDQSIGEDGFRITKLFSSRPNYSQTFFVPADAEQFSDNSGFFDQSTVYEISAFVIGKSDTLFSEAVHITINAEYQIRITSNPTQEPLNMLTWDVGGSFPISGFRARLHSVPYVNADTVYLLPANSAQVFFHDLFKKVVNEYHVELEAFLYNGQDTVVVDEVDFTYPSSDLDFTMTTAYVKHPDTLTFRGNFAGGYRAPIELGYMHNGSFTRLTALTDTVPTLNYGHNFSVAIPQPLVDGANYSLEYRALTLDDRQPTRSIDFSAYIDYAEQNRPHVDLISYEGKTLELQLNNGNEQIFDVVVINRDYFSPLGAGEIDRFPPSLFNDGVLNYQITIPNDRNRAMLDFRFEYDPLIRRTTFIYGFSPSGNQEITFANGIQQSWVNNTYQAFGYDIDLLYSSDLSGEAIYATTDGIGRLDFVNHQMKALHLLDPRPQHSVVYVNYRTSSVSENKIGFFYDGKFHLLDRFTLQKESELDGFPINRWDYCYVKYFEDNHSLLVEFENGTVQHIDLNSGDRRTLNLDRLLIPSNNELYAVAYHATSNAVELLDSELNPVREIDVSSPGPSLNRGYARFNNSGETVLFFNAPVNSGNNSALVADLAASTVQHVLLNNFQFSHVDDPLINLPFLSNDKSILYFINANTLAIRKTSGDFSQVRIPDLPEYSQYLKIIGYSSEENAIYLLSRSRGTLYKYELSGWTMTSEDTWQ